MLREKHKWAGIMPSSYSPMPIKINIEVAVTGLVIDFTAQMAFTKHVHSTFFDCNHCCYGSFPLPLMRLLRQEFGCPTHRSPGKFFFVCIPIHLLLYVLNFGHVFFKVEINAIVFAENYLSSKFRILCNQIK